MLNLRVKLAYPQTRRHNHPCGAFPTTLTRTEASDVEHDGHTHHAIDYIEFVVTDMAASKRFYEAAFDCA